jgi:hypothetical protein
MAELRTNKNRKGSKGCDQTKALTEPDQEKGE